MPRAVCVVNPDKQTEAELLEWAEQNTELGAMKVTRTACSMYGDTALVFDREYFRLRIDDLKALAKKLGFVFSGASKALWSEVREKYVPDSQMSLF